MDTLRTPDDRFEDLPGYTFTPRYSEVPDTEGGSLRIHHVDEGSSDTVVLCMHGEPTWSFLYRKMIPRFVDAGLRAVAPDLAGFGKSDKPTELHDYSYQRHVDWMTSWLEAIDLNRITLVCQDWGGLIGLRLAAENPERFDRIVVANTGLPTGREQPSKAFLEWRKYSQESPKFDVGRLIGQSCGGLSEEVTRAYDAPFPDDRYKAGARQFPSLVPISEDDPAAEANRRAWAVFAQWTKPVLTAFSDNDPITAGGERPFQTLIPGAQGQPHATIAGAPHFLQEVRGEELADVVIDFIGRP